MGLLVTLFLVLVNIFNSVTANAPKSEGLTAVETWVVMCILHVFCVLSEYAIILKIIQMEKRKNETLRRAHLSVPGGNGAAASASAAAAASSSSSAAAAAAAAATVPQNLRSRGGGLSGSLSAAKAHLRLRPGSGSSTPQQLEHIFESDPEYHVSAAGGGRAFNSETNTGNNSGGMESFQLLNHRCPHGNRTLVSEHHLHQQHQALLLTEDDLGEDQETIWNKMDLGGSNTPQSPPLSSLQQQPQGTSPLAQSKLASAPPPLAPEQRRFINQDKYERIDRMAMWLFPIIFFIFNICYWSYYLVLNEILPELW